MTNFMKIFGEISLQQAAEILAAEYPPCDKCAYKSDSGCNAHCADGVLKWLTQETENEPVWPKTNPLLKEGNDSE